MAKKENGLATSGEYNALALPGAAEMFSTPTVVNADPSDRLIPVLHLFQGTTEEQEKLGKFDLGDLIDTVEKRKVASREIAVVRGQKSYVKWEKGNPIPVYTTTNKAEVPPEDLEWRDQNDGKKPHPACTETFEFLVVVIGEPWPYLLRFKSTSFKCGRSLFELCERSRAQKRVSTYTLEATKTKNEQGTFAVPSVRQSGTATQDIAGLVFTLFGQFNNKPVRVAEEAAPQTEDADLPI